MLSFVLFSSFSSYISIVGVEYKLICLVLLAGVAGVLCSPWFWRNKKFTWDLYSSLLFLFRTLDFFSKKRIFLYVLSKIVLISSNINFCFCSAMAEISWLILGSIWMKSFWSANSFVVLFFLAVLMNLLVLSGQV